MSSSSGGTQTRPPVLRGRHGSSHGRVAFLVSLVLVFALCFAYEGLIAYRARYDASLNDAAVFPVASKAKPQATFPQQLVRSSLFAASNAYSLFIMMVFMLFNGYMCIACVAGAFAGHLTFAVCMPEEELGKRPRSCCD